eukprot:XP_011662859.1 PREDICTED: flocculation protein FLO11-like [Strongylocentrotus purpuratus]
MSVGLEPVWTWFDACSTLPISDASRVVTSASGNYSLSSVVILSCNSTGHYTPSGTQFSVCIGNNTWIPDSSTFICYDQCPSDLFPTDIVHVSENKGAKSFYDHNEVISLSCVEGATLRGSDMVTCSDGDLVMASQPECMADCLSPDLATPVETYSDGDVASFSCTARSTQPPLATVTCRDGSWEPPFECFDKCEMPSSADGGLHLSFSPDQDGLYDHGDIIALSCSSPGYVINGVNVTRCDNGSWIPSGSPSCQQEPTQSESQKEIPTQSETTIPPAQVETTDQESTSPDLSTTSTVRTPITTGRLQEPTDKGPTNLPVTIRNILTTLREVGKEITSPNVLDTTEATSVSTSSTLTTHTTPSDHQWTLPDMANETKHTTAERVTEIFNLTLLPTGSTKDFSTEEQLITEQQLTSTVTDEYPQPTFLHSTAGGVVSLPGVTPAIPSETTTSSYSVRTSDELTVQKEYITEIPTSSVIGLTDEQAKERKTTYVQQTFQDITEAANIFTEIVVETSESRIVKEPTSQAERATEPYLSTTREATENTNTPRTRQYITITAPDTSEIVDTFTEVTDLGEGTSDPLTTKEFTSETEYITKPYLSTTREATEKTDTPRTTQYITINAPGTTEVVETLTEVTELGEGISEPITTKEFTSETEYITKPYLSTTREAKENKNTPRTTQYITITAPNTSEVVETLTEVTELGEGTSDPLLTKELKSETEYITEPYLSTTREASEYTNTPRTTRYITITAPGTTEVVDTFTEVTDLGDGTSEPLTTKEFTSETEYITKPYLSTTREATENTNTPRTTQYITITAPGTTEVVETLTEVTELGEGTSDPLTTKEFTSETEYITKPYLSTTREATEKTDTPRITPYITIIAPGTTEVVDTFTEVTDPDEGTSETNNDQRVYK